MAYSKEKQREYAKQHYIDNKELYKARARKSNKNVVLRNRNFVAKYKESKQCSDCDGVYVACQLDLDHVSGKKLDNVSRMIRSPISLEKIIAEINKCEVVCANCHRLRTKEKLPLLLE